MKIIHFAPFAPNACGLYEAARDMIVADRLAGHQSDIVDVGTTVNNEYIPGEAGKIDERGRDRLESVDPIHTESADILVAHTGVPDAWLAFCQAPLVWVMHGRPQACFGPEQFGKYNSYSLISSLAVKPRVKVMLSFWPYHQQFWNVVVPEEKLVVLDAPVVDGRRFSPKGYTHDFAELGGETNIVLADSTREDVDLYEVAHGALEFCKRQSGVKFHFYGMDPAAGCWNFITNQLRMLGGLGEMWARRSNMEEIYRAADLVLSPHRITTRVIAEALCCETPVVAASGLEHATWTCNVSNPGAVADVLVEAVDLCTSKEVRESVREMKKNFSFDQFNAAMTQVYEKALNN